MNPKEILGLYENMLLSRRFEQKADELYKAGQVTGSLHLYIGEEAIGAVAMLMREEGDLFTSTHRGVGHTVLCGCDPNQIMAELFGKATGISGGKGGSMHMFDQAHGLLGTNGIVGGGTSLACGAGITLKLVNQTDRVVFCFLGEGASNEGVTHESMNLAAVWKLPVIFVVENNGYEVFTTAQESCSVEDIAVRASGYGMPGAVVDGNDVIKLGKTYRKAIDRARRGEGPSLIEAKTYRWSGHWPGDAYSYGGYRSKEEVDEWKLRCPILRLGKLILEKKYATQEELDAINRKVDQRVEDSVAFAIASPEPDDNGLMQNLFA